MLYGKQIGDFEVMKRRFFMKKVTKLDPYKESQKARKSRVQAEGNRFKTRVVADKKKTYNRQKAKKEAKNAE